MYVKAWPTARTETEDSSRSPLSKLLFALWKLYTFTAVTSPCEVSTGSSSGCGLDAAGSLGGWYLLDLAGFLV